MIESFYHLIHDAAVHLRYQASKSSTQSRGRNSCDNDDIMLIVTGLLLL